jgi:ferredoxin/coenzyme F420-reducing hydrogenase delta subunit
VIRTAERAALAAFRRTEAAFDSVFTERYNPFYQLGALAFLYFWIVTASGIYLFVFFDTSITGAYASVERLTVEQWWLGGVMRSLHRYASAALAITVTVHLLREFALGRFRGARAFSWVSGVPLLWLLFASAIGGYLLVWDMLAQYLAVATAEWLDWLPISSDPLARNFFKPGSMSDRLFSLLVFLHIAIPLFLLAGMFIHVKRLKLARSNPARGLAAGTCAAFVVASLVHPATSMAPADLTRAPAVVDLDWIYLNAYPLLDVAGPWALWALLGAVTVALTALPRLSPGSARERPAPALVDPANCNGCSWCFQDCPFEAITMMPHQDKAGLRQAMVNPDLCTGCGICAGACPSATPFRHVDELVSGIEIPGYPLQQLRQRTVEELDRLPADGATLVFGCDHAADVAAVAGGGIASVSLPCIAVLPPSFVDWTARQPQIDSVVVSGCHPDDCYQRKGSAWMAERLAGQRHPHLRTSDGRAKVTVCWAGRGQHRLLAAVVAEHEAGDPVANGCAEEGHP